MIQGSPTRQRGERGRRAPSLTRRATNERRLIARKGRSKPATGRAAGSVAGRTSRRNGERPTAVHDRRRGFAEEFLDGAGAAIRTRGPFASPHEQLEIASAGRTAKF